MRSKYIKALSLMIILVMTVFCFTGCLRFRTTMSIRNNGKADLAIIYAFQQDLIGEDFEDEFEDVVDAFEDEGWTADDYKKGDYRGYLFTMTNVRVNDFEEIFNSDAFDKLGLGEFELTKKSSTYTIEWHTDASSDVEEEGVSASDLSAFGGFMEVVIELPSPAKDENATNVSRDGKTLTWNLFEEDDIEVTFTLVNVGLIIAVIVIFVVLIAAAAVVVILLVLKKKKTEDGNKSDEVPAAQVSSPEPSSPIDFSAPIPAPVAPATPVEPAAPAAPAPESPADPAT